MKKIIAVVLAIFCIAGVFAGGKKDTKGDPNQMTVLWRRFDDPFQSGFRIIMETESRKISNGFTLDMQDGEDDPSRSLNKIEMSLTRGVKNIAICAPNRQSTQRMMEACKAENVPVIFFNMEPLPETMAAYDKIWYVGANASESGEMCAQALINYWNANREIADKNNDGVLQIVILQGEIGQQDVVLRTQAYKDTLAKNGIKYEILAEDTANWDRAQAQDKMTAWFSAYGVDGIEGVLCNSDGMAMGAVQAALNNGYNRGDKNKFIPIVGIDATIEALESMKSGALLGTVLNDRSSQSIAVLNLAKAIRDGSAITAQNLGVKCTVDGKYIWVPYAIVDQTNLDSTLKLMLELENK